MKFTCSTDKIKRSLQIDSLKASTQKRIEPTARIYLKNIICPSTKYLFENGFNDNNNIE